MASAERPTFTQAVPTSAKTAAEGEDHFACWTDRKGQKVRALILPSGKCRRVVANRWIGIYRDHHGKKSKTKPFGDRSAALSAALALERKGRDVRDGRAVADQPTGRAHLIDHLPNYLAHLRGKGQGERWLTIIEKIFRDKIRIHGLTTAASVDAQKLQDGFELDRLAGDPRRAENPKRTGPLSIRTRNIWVTVFRSFGRWLVRTHRLPVNPFDALALGNADTDPRLVRRSLPMAEFERLLAAAKASKDSVGGLAGPDRAALYLLAGFTGLRVGALAQLTPEAFTWAHDRPAAVYSSARLQKNKSAHGIPIAESAGKELAKWLEKKKQGQPLWTGNVYWSAQAAKMIRRDLAAAKIPFRDAAGQVFDFHALRGQFGKR